MLDPRIITALTRELVSAFKEEGLVLVPREVGEHGMAFYKKQKDLLRRKHVTPYEIEKYKLIPGINSLQTIKNMIADGRIAAHEVFIGEKGVRVLVTAVKRLINE